MGHCQGLAYRAAIEQRIALGGGRTRRSRFPTLRALTSGTSLGRGPGRELIRHYTHLAERMAGIARSADVPFDSLMELFCRETCASAPDEGPLAPAVAVGLAGEAGVNPILMRSLAGKSLASSAWILRRSRPDVGFVSAEVTLPWLASAVAGINEAGLAVAVAPRSVSQTGGVTADAVNPFTAPHALLLVQECLQRFEDLEGCLDWCQKRPCSGNLSLIIVDASARLARVEVEGSACRVVDVGQPHSFAGPPQQIEHSLHANLHDRAPADLASLSEVAATIGPLAVWLEPRRRKLSLRVHPAAAPDEKSVELSL